MTNQFASIYKKTAAVLLLNGADNWFGVPQILLGNT